MLKALLKVSVAIEAATMQQESAAVKLMIKHIVTKELQLR